LRNGKINGENRTCDCIRLQKDKRNIFGEAKCHRTKNWRIAFVWQIITGSVN